MDRIIFAINCMTGGGAERVITFLAEHTLSLGMHPVIVLTGQSLSEAMLYKRDGDIEYRSIPDEAVEAKLGMAGRASMYIYRAAAALFKKLEKRPPEQVALRLYELKNKTRIHFLQKLMADNRDAPIVAFLDDSILLAILAVKALPNRIIISERGDVSQHAASVRATAAINRLYRYADCIVCQTDEAAEFYATRVPSLKRVVIPNPIKKDLPMRFTGERRKVVINFCRIDPQKNLPLLLDAFAVVYRRHLDYRLEIVGEPSNSVDRHIVEKLNAKIKTLGLEDTVTIMGFRKDIHEYAADCAVFVSSSDFEGLSNSMLEAMAMGLPTVCTDCLGGGARMMIEDHVNGLLVPREDAAALADAICEIIEDRELADRLSVNGEKVRSQLDSEKICKKWLDVILDRPLEDI